MRPHAGTYRLRCSRSGMRPASGQPSACRVHSLESPNLAKSPNPLEDGVVVLELKLVDVLSLYLSRRNRERGCCGQQGFRRTFDVLDAKEGADVDDIDLVLRRVS